MNNDENDPISEEEFHLVMGKIGGTENAMDRCEQLLAFLVQINYKQLVEIRRVSKKYESNIVGLNGGKIG